MKTLRTLLAPLLVALCVLPLAARAADRGSVHAILVLASSAKGPADGRLAAYEAELQRNLPESSFRFAGEGSAALPAGGRASIALGGGHRVDLVGEAAAGGRVRVNVTWIHGRTEMLSTGLSLRPGVPAVLLRRSGGNADVPLVILIAR